MKEREYDIEEISLDVVAKLEGSTYRWSGMIRVGHGKFSEYFIADEFAQYSEFQLLAKDILDHPHNYHIDGEITKIIHNLDLQCLDVIYTDEDGENTTSVWYENVDVVTWVNFNSDLVTLPKKVAFPTLFGDNN